MKKLLFFSVFLFLLTTVFGQSPWWVGGKLGINFTTVNGKYGNNYSSDNKWITSPLFGATAMYSFSDLIGISAELNLAKSGALYDLTFIGSDGTEGEGTLKERYTTIQIPVHARFTFGETWQFFAYGGFYWSYILCGKYVAKSEYFDDFSGKIKFGDRPEDYNGDDMYLDKDYNRRMDIGLNIGGGVQRQLGPGALLLDLRFGLGFLDSNKFPDDDKPDGYKPFLNRSLSLSVAYIFNLGK